MMQTNTIETRLKTYKSDLSKLHLIECSMKELESEIQVIEPSYISAVQYSETPKSITNKFSSIVENSVLEIEKDRAEINRLNADLWQLAKDRIILKCKTDYVEALLVGLTEEERFVIEKFYFDGLAWHIVAEKYRKEYGVYKTLKTMRAKRDDAIRKMERNSSATPKIKSPV